MSITDTRTAGSQALREGQAKADRQRLESEIVIMGADPAEMKALYRESELACKRQAEKLSTPETYCLFIGYPRSGHSLIGALLDAHPDIVVAHELNVLKYLEAGFDLPKIQYLMLENSLRSARAGRVWGTYDYSVAHGWQGQIRQLRVLGDKKGGFTTLQIGNNGERLNALLELFEHKVKFLHVIRNPFDVIAIMARKSNLELAEAIEQFFFLAETNKSVREKLGRPNFTDIKYEQTLKDIEGTLKNLCNFLGVTPEPEYLSSCAAVVKTLKSRSRDKISWPPDLVSKTEKRLAHYDFLANYTFAD